MTDFLILTSLVCTEQANLAVSRQLINVRDAILQTFVVRSFEILFPTGDPDINICSTHSTVFLKISTAAVISTSFLNST